MSKEKSKKAEPKRVHYVLALPEEKEPQKIKVVLVDPKKK